MPTPPLDLRPLLLPCLLLSVLLIPLGDANDQECAFPNAVYSIPGDVAFMGIFNLRGGDTCSTDHGPEFDTIQGVIQTLERLNRLGNVPGGGTIGLHLYDACSTSTKAEKAMVNALFDMECSHTYSLGLLTTAPVAQALTSIISNLHLPHTILDTHPSLPLPLLFNASFSFLQSVQMTRIHVAILPSMQAVTSFTNLATTYRLCVNNPMTYRHVEDSKDKIVPDFSEDSTAVLVGTLEEYRTHASYLQSVSRNILFIPTDIGSSFDTEYFKVLKNGTFVVSPYHYELSKNEEQPAIQNTNEHPFIQKLNENFEFNINMKFIHNSLKIFREVEEFKLKYHEDCGEKTIKNCTDLKPLLSEQRDVQGRKDNVVEDFINSFQVDNTETSINGVYVYRTFRSESEEEIAEATALLPSEEPQERIEDAKKKLLLDINNTNFENMGKRDLILSSIHIVTSEAYDTDVLEIEKNDEDSNAENKENVMNDDPKQKELSDADVKSGNIEIGIENLEEDRHDDNSTHNMENPEDLDTQMENNSSHINDPVKDLVDRYQDKDEIENSEGNVSSSVVNDELEVNTTDKSENSETATIPPNIMKDKIIENRMYHLQKRILEMKLSNSKGEKGERVSRISRSIKESPEIRMESIGKYSYVNNSWLVVLNEDENLREGNEQFLCRVISEDMYGNSNETMETPGKDCAACYNFREIYQLIELNKKDIEDSKKQILDIMFKVELKTDSFTVVIISLSVMGLIGCIVVFGFIMYRIMKRDVLEGNPTITVLLLLSIMYNYLVITPFVVNIEPNIEYFDYYSHLLCYIRLISIITSFNFIFSLLLTRCLMLSFCDHDGALMSHINGYIQSSFCFFITIIQILFLINLFLIKFIFNVDIKCDIIQGNYIFMLGYNLILLFLLALTVPFIYKCRRNYFEGIYMTITICSIVLAWIVWIYLYIDSNYNESLVVLGIFLTSTLILIIIFIPRTYHMMINIVRDNITSILPALSSQYMSAGNIHNIHYRSTQALYDIVNDTENKHLGEINPYYVSRNETKQRPNTIYQTSHNVGQEPVHESYYMTNQDQEDDDDPTSLYNEDITGRLQSSLGMQNLKSPTRSHRQSPSFKCRVKSPSIASRAASPPQIDDLYDTSPHETTSRCETRRFDTPSTMTRF